MSDRAQFKRHFNKGKRLAGKRDYQAAIVEFEEALKIKNTDLDTIFELGNMARKMKLYDISLEWYNIALKISPAQSEVLFNRALSLKLSGRNDEALKAFEDLSPIMGREHIFWNNFGNLLRQMGDKQRAVTCFEEALKLKPDDGRYWNNKALVLADLDQWDEVFTCLMKAERDLKGNPEFHVNLAKTYFEAGDIEKAWANYEWRHHLEHQNAREYRHQIPWWRGEDLTGKTILVAGEQGIGDEIALFTCLPGLIAQAGRVVVEAAPKIAMIFARNFPEIEVRIPHRVDIGMRFTHLYDWIEKEGYAFDFFAPIGNVFGALRPTIEDFPLAAGPLLSARRELVDLVSTKLKDLNPAGLPLFGVSWRSTLLTGTRSDHYFSAKEMADLMASAGQPSCFVNLQYGITQQEIAEIKAACAGGPHSFIEVPEVDLFNDLETVLALIDCLDGVFAVSNTQLVLAGALGKDCVTTVERHFIYGYKITDLSFPTIVKREPAELFSGLGSDRFDWEFAKLFLSTQVSLNEEGLDLQPGFYSVRDAHPILNRRKDVAEYVRAYSEGLIALSRQEGVAAETALNRAKAIRPDLLPVDPPFSLP